MINRVVITHTNRRIAVFRYDYDYHGFIARIAPGYRLHCIGGFRGGAGTLAHFFIFM